MKGSFPRNNTSSDEESVGADNDGMYTNYIYILPELLTEYNSTSETYLSEPTHEEPPQPRRPQPRPRPRYPQNINARPPVTGVGACIDLMLN